jgi:tRNA splicing endonuclease
MYHAQFTVRVLRWEEALLPLQLQSWGRGAHAARKHLLLASVDPVSARLALASVHHRSGVLG